MAAFYELAVQPFFSVLSLELTPSDHFYLSIVPKIICHFYLSTLAYREKNKFSPVLRLTTHSANHFPRTFEILLIMDIMVKYALSFIVSYRGCKVHRGQVKVKKQSSRND